MKFALSALAVILGCGFAHAQYQARPKADHEHAAQQLQHSGGLDAYGCHTNHKTGDYHCHR